jgi:hypothetical protein
MFVFDSRRYQIFWEVVGLERGPLSLVITIEELLERKSRGSGLKSREYGLRGSAAHTTQHPSIRESRNFANKRRSLGRYSSLVDKGHCICLLFANVPDTWFGSRVLLEIEIYINHFCRGMELIDFSIKTWLVFTNIRTNVDVQNSPLSLIYKSRAFSELLWNRPVNM